MSRHWIAVGPLLLLWLRATPGLLGFASELEVRAGGGTLWIRSHAAPVSEVLDRISRETGLKVVYEGPRPSQRVSINLQGLPESEALPRLLEGLGLNYALQTDAGGRRVVMLVVTGSTTPAASTAGVMPVRSAMPPAIAASQSAEAETEEPPPLDMADTEASDPSPDPGFPPGSVLGSPAPGSAFGPAGQPAAGASSSAGIPTVSPFGPDPTVPAPSFPGQPSMPAPYFPPGASNPSPD